MSLKLVGAAATLSLALLGIPTAADAHAPSTTYQIFDFSGTCQDCTGVGTAVLGLENYTPGTSLSSDGVYPFSFTYKSSSLDYIIYSVDHIEGSISDAKGGYEVSLTGEGYYASDTDTDLEFYFTSHQNGDWSTGPLADADHGVGGTWNDGLPQVSAAPEPQTWSLLIAGLMGLGATFRLRSPRRRLGIAM